MITLRKSEERGSANFGWLDTRHTFSFGHYWDPRWEQFRDLRVINEDWVEPGRGFPTHPHRDMEIITYVLEGALEHRDSTGGGAVIRPGDVQRMSAGRGIAHSEFNHSKEEPVHLLQIWIHPERKGLAPGYEQKEVRLEERRGRLRLLASRDGREGTVTIHQDVSLYSTILAPGQAVAHPLAKGRHAWVQVARGSIVANGERLAQGDGLGISESAEVTIEAAGEGEAEVLVFDLK
jgi:hypothetical protein